MKLPNLGENLSEEQINFLQSFRQSSARTIIQMLDQSQSGHPGGSLSSLDFLAIVYAFLISQHGNPIVVSNGHISPAVYSVLAEMGYLEKEAVIEGFRKIGRPYEGHVTRHVPGIWYGTGPLGIGTSAASGFALAEKIKETNQTVYCLVGDGEAQEGQVYEMLNFTAHHQLNNLVMFMDYNQVQLTDSLSKILPIQFKELFLAAGWNVLEVDGHNFSELWQALYKAENSDKPTLILGNTIMGKGVPQMEESGRKFQADWHGKAPSHDLAAEILAELELSSEESIALDQFRKNVAWQPKPNNFPKNCSPNPTIQTGAARLYPANEAVDCRTAYGKALLDLAKLNSNVLALTADLRGSVMTKFVAEELPEQHIEVGIAEQHMVSLSGALSLAGMLPFCSTFGAFMSSRAKDQARVNDINHCNVKMVATHCGLSVGEDGPTHQSIDDMSSFLGMYNTEIIEPVDANQTDKIIRYIASVYGNFYVRMGRHKFNPITKEDGSLFYDESYQFVYGKSDLIREGSDLTIVANGATVSEALRAMNENSISADLLAVSSIKSLDEQIFESIRKTGKLITVEDHNLNCGLGTQVLAELAERGISGIQVIKLGVAEYQLSGTWDQLYQAAGIDHQAIAKAMKKLMNQ